MEIIKEIAAGSFWPPARTQEGSLFFQEVDEAINNRLVGLGLFEPVEGRRHPLKVYEGLRLQELAVAARNYESINNDLFRLNFKAWVLTEVNSLYGEGLERRVGNFFINMSHENYSYCYELGESDLRLSLAALAELNIANRQGIDWTIDEASLDSQDIYSLNRLKYEIGRSVLENIEHTVEV